MCFHHNHFHFVDLFSSIIIPTAAIYIAVGNTIYNRRKDNRELNQIVYREKFKYSFEQLFNNKFITETGTLNIPFIKELIGNIISFNKVNESITGIGIFSVPFIHKLIKNIISYKKVNEFYGNRAKRKFKKISKCISKEMHIDATTMKYSGRDVAFYDVHCKELVLLRKEYLKFYKIIFGAI